MSRLRQLLWVVLCAVVFGVNARAAEDAAGMEFFESKIRPILVDNCYSCHSRTATKVKGNLLLDTKADLLKGGDTGPGIVLGDVEASLLIKAVRYTNDDLKMPPKNKKLAPEQIAALETWVKMGAPDPRTGAGIAAGTETIRDKAKKHWAFLPVVEPKIPKARNAKAVQTPVDNFVLTRLESNGLHFSARADKRTLIRRAYFDLIGLPSTPEEVAAFETDRSPEAFAKVVDRLLASPRYGERWGRHWLDVARYADTRGYVFEEDRHYAYAYTYRDYVIRSFNEDLPYDEFLKEQIAADLLPGATNNQRSLAALGYLTLGRRFINNPHDIIDDRIDVVCRGMMGLTVACARCHDHKFDPIPTRDYYSLYGIFASSMEPDAEPLLGIEPPLEARKEYEGERTKRVEERDKFRAKSEKEMAAKLREQSPDYMLAALETQRAEKPDAEAVAHSHKLDPEVLRRWISGLETWKTNDAAVFGPWFEFAKLSTNAFGARSREIGETFARTNFNPLVTKAFAGEAPTNMSEVAARYGKVFAAVDEQWEKRVGGTNASSATALDDPAGEALRQILYAANAPANLPRDQFDRLYDTPTGQKLRELQRHVAELDASSPGAPQRAMAMVDRPDPHDEHIFVRGNPDNPGPEAPREFLEELSPAERKPFNKGSGRLQLAEDIASKDNPLTARVLVNRVWMYHFGAPLVATPSDFGLRSDPPTNPELLDFLAARFMADGWSIKKLHRLIMLSRAYQQTSDFNAMAAKADPNNNLLWRMNRQRLDFEATRDTLLAVSGKLDLTEGGHAVEITEPTATRRTVYGYIDRQNLPDMFRAFDFASPDASSPRRFYTTVPQQALFLMNSPFIVKQAEAFAQKPKAAANANEKERVRRLFEQAYDREPTREEIAWATEFLHAPKKADAPAAPSWLYGYGAFDDASSRVKAFTPLPYFDGHNFQGGRERPDAKLGWVLLNDSGGHPGNDQAHAAIRRWTAPRDGIISISGTLAHPSDQGDGVRGRIVSSRLGKLGEWRARNNKAEAGIDRVEVRRGDTIDFATDCLSDCSYDSFTWAPTIRFDGADKLAAGEKKEWSAADDFMESAPVSHPSLDRWDELAQAILMSDELVFVD